MLIEVKVRVARVIDGKARWRTETYILDREFFSNAEYTVTEVLNAEQQQGLIEDFYILSLRQSAIKEIDEQTIDNNRPSFIATLIDIFLQDDGSEKKMKYKVLLWAENLTEANHRANELSHQGYNMLIESIKQVDYEYLVGTSETNNTEEEAGDE
mgnify:CR=1 FL=1